MKREFPLWRIWSEKGTSIEELRYKWTYPDVLKANAILDMQADFETGMNEIDRRDMEKR